MMVGDADCLRQSSAVSVVYAKLVCVLYLLWIRLLVSYTIQLCIFGVRCYDGRV